MELWWNKLEGRSTLCAGVCVCVCVCVCARSSRADGLFSQVDEATWGLLSLFHSLINALSAQGLDGVQGRESWGWQKDVRDTHIEPHRHTKHTHGKLCGQKDVLGIVPSRRYQDLWKVLEAGAVDDLECS